MRHGANCQCSLCESTQSAPNFDAVISVNDGRLVAEEIEFLYGFWYITYRYISTGYVSTPQTCLMDRWNDLTVTEEWNE